MRRAVVVNCSAPSYNLGARKLADWLLGEGYEVRAFDSDPGILGMDADLVCLSVIFSWHAPLARAIALRMKPYAEVWCGGPGMFDLGRWWQQETGLELTRGLDWRFERQRGDYVMTFASRGCPVNCYFCIVPRLEGREFTLDWDFQPAPILSDNNLSALPVEFQEHIIRRYQETGTKLHDAQSGFEPAAFHEDTYIRWKPILRGPWRFAFDTIDEAEEVLRMMEILHDESPRKKQVYVLLGNEPPVVCLERVRKVIEWGGEPYCQPMTPLNALEKRPKVAYGWTETMLRDLARWTNRHLWRSVPLEDYRPRQGEAPPFTRWAKSQNTFALVGTSK